MSGQESNKGGVEGFGKLVVGTVVAGAIVGAVIANSDIYVTGEGDLPANNVSVKVELNGQNIGEGEAYTEKGGNLACDKIASEYQENHPENVSEYQCKGQKIKRF